MTHSSAHFDQAVDDFLREPEHDLLKNLLSELQESDEQNPADDYRGKSPQRRRRGNATRPHDHAFDRLHERLDPASKEAGGSVERVDAARANGPVEGADRSHRQREV